MSASSRLERFGASRWSAAREPSGAVTRIATMAALARPPDRRASGAMRMEVPPCGFRARDTHAFAERIHEGRLGVLLSRARGLCRRRLLRARCALLGRRRLGLARRRFIGALVVTRRSDLRRLTAVAI